jgi:AraC family transcriptional regulator
MSEQLQTAGAPALAAINAFVRGSSTRLCTSSALGWDGVHLEHHRAFPVERNDSVSPQHLVALFTSHVSRGETSVAQSRFVPYAFPPGAVKLYSAGPIGACRPVSDTTVVLCALDPELVVEAGEESGMSSTVEFSPIALFRDPPLEGIVTLLAAEANSGGVSGRLYAGHLAHALALRFRQLSGGTPAATLLRFGKMPTRVLQRVLDRMKADFGRDLDLNILAAESGYSRSHFLRTFRASMGYSPHQWLMRLRIEEAKALLQRKSRSLLEIALECGFSSHAHFSRTFHQITGAVPSEYRRDVIGD